jgi:hypothetical protein
MQRIPQLVLGYLPELLGSCFVLLGAWKLWRKKWMNYWNEKRAERMREMAERLRSRIPHGLVRLYTMFWIVFTVGIVVVVAYGFAHPRDFPIEKHRNVYVWSQVKGTTDSWWISSYEGGNSLPFNTWKCCPDFPCSTVIWPGYVAEVLKYEERGSCKSLRASGLGVWWKTDEHGDVKEIP